VDRNYATDQGISSRAHCIIYLAIKAEVLAIEAGIENNAAEKDFYVSDLWQIFCAVLEQSMFQEAVWESDQSNSEFPTPYAYLLSTIAYDLDDLSAAALAKAVSMPAALKLAAPARLPSDLARMWSACVSYVPDSAGHVSPAFRKSIIQQYLLFVLALKSAPHEILLYGQNVDAAVVCQWRDLYLGALTSRIVSASAVERDAIRHAFESLDMGKHYVYEGYEWLEDALFGNHLSTWG
jgi:hypothetical protein